jgi:hypothetical protein
VSIKLYEGVKPMGFLWTDQDIVKHVQGIGKITFATGAHVRSQGGKDINLKPWTEHFDVFSLDDSFFFEPGHDSMDDTTASLMAVLRSPPLTNDGKTFVKERRKHRGGTRIPNLLILIG